MRTPIALYWTRFHDLLTSTTIPGGLFGLTIGTIPVSGRRFLSRRGGKCQDVVTFSPFLVRIIMTASAKPIMIYLVATSHNESGNSVFMWNPNSKRHVAAWNTRATWYSSTLNLLRRRIGKPGRQTAARHHKPCRAQSRLLEDLEPSTGINNKVGTRITND